MFYIWDYYIGHGNLNKYEKCITNYFTLRFTFEMIRLKRTKIPPGRREKIMKMFPAMFTGCSKQRDVTI